MHNLEAAISIQVAVARELKSHDLREIKAHIRTRGPAWVKAQIEDRDNCGLSPGLAEVWHEIFAEELPPIRAGP